MSAAALEPGSDEWLKVITASKVAAILGVSPWDSPRSLYHSMRGELPREATTDEQSRGHYLEPAIIAWWRDRHPEYTTVTRAHLALRDELPWSAANLDALAEGPDVEPAVVEAKSAANEWEWGREGTDEVPAYYAAQAMWAMHLSGTRRTYMPVITAHLEFREYVIEYDSDLATDIEQACYRFWCDVMDGTAPDLDGHVATFESVRRLHPQIDQGSSVELLPEVAREFVEATAARKDAEARERRARAAVTDAMGSFHRAVCGEQVIAQRQRTSAGTPALYAARRPVDLDALPPVIERTHAA
ncbi:lambda-exonuclease family protein [Cellulomonas sp.]|uniref:lambda-exonuclease family protein n=1 Tax=Cellulomonas sp. TaxID=40001 RepID=UPI001B16361A|nr:YqaJ viral recombinase family protein [Cellulomonas sp.]MBO9555554.1 YqaJ viral recombinase family protein [Cellulomonas sp.]